MEMKRIGLTLLLLFVSATSFAALTPGDHELTLNHGGRERSYIVHIPTRTTEPLPVILAFHGGGGNAAQFKRQIAIESLSDRERFIVVFPNGSGRGEHLLTWNAGSCCAWSQQHNVDDVGFTRAVIRDLAARTRIDSRRIYATGFSNGAMMTYRLAAEAPDLIRAIAPVSGSMMTAARLTKRMSILHIHSVDDPRALYKGGLAPPFPFTDYRVQHPDVEVQLHKWITLDGCASQPHVTKKLSDRDTSATRLDFTPCASGATVTLWKLTGSEHVWPGAAKTRGKPNRLIDANEEIWRFFKSLK
jgi:polyhydroxybutyrate depolymerase